METVHEWIQCSVKSIIALRLREWIFYEENGGNIKIILLIQTDSELSTTYNFVISTRIGIISYRVMFSFQEGVVYTYRRLILEGMHLPLSYIPSLRDTLHQRCGGVNINLVELNVDDRKELLPHVWTCTSLLKISRTNEFIGIIIYKNSFQQSSK